MKKNQTGAIRFLTLLVLLLAGSLPTHSAPTAPLLSYSQSGHHLQLNWYPVDEATDYRLLYAPIPKVEPKAIAGIDLGSATSFAVDLWENAAFYFAVEATDAQEAGSSSSVSNIEAITLSSEIKNLCRVEQPVPYFDGSYVGIHGNAGNNEQIPCNGPQTAPQAGWHALQGSLIFNPSTVSDDRIYSVITRTDGCKLWVIDIESGDEDCLPKEDPENLSFGVLGSSPELDEQENVYVTDGWGSHPDGMVSYTRDGDLRWRTSFQGLRPLEPSEYWPPLGLHFTASGYAATVAPDGLVVLLDMDTGQILAHFDITERTSLRPLEPEPMTVPDQLPQYLECRIRNVLGDDLDPRTLMEALAGGTGGSGHYTDNSLAVVDDLLLVVGGSVGTYLNDMGEERAENGALVALKITESAVGPRLALAWYMETNGPTGSSPTVDATGRWAVVSDTTDDGHARLVAADLRTCALAEGRSPPLCLPSWTYQLEGSALNASIAMDQWGVVYAWNQGPDDDGIPSPTLVAVAPPDALHSEPQQLWSTRIRATTPGRWTSSEWSSTPLILNDLIVGTVSHLNATGITDDLDLPLPLTVNTAHELVGISRDTGEILWRNDQLADDSINSPFLGPNGNLYVPILGMIDFAQPPLGQVIPDSCDEFEEVNFSGGLVQFLADGNSPTVMPDIVEASVTPAPHNSLAAVLSVRTTAAAQVRARVINLDGREQVSVFSDRATAHRIELAGLHARTRYDVVVEVFDHNGDITGTTRLPFTSGAVPPGLPSFRVENLDTSGTAGAGITIFGPQARLSESGDTDEASYSGPIFVGVDREGEVVWYLENPDPGRGPKDQDVKPLSDGNLLYFSGSRIGVVSVSGETLLSLTADDLGGREIHHDVIALPGGNFMALTRERRRMPIPLAEEPVEVVGDVLVEFTPTGKVVWTWSSFDHLAIDRFPNALSQVPKADGSYDWTHGNAIVYRDQDNSVLLSLRHQNWVVKIDRASGEILWRLGPEGDFTLTGAATDPTADWFYAQHAPQWQEDGSLLLYDNGTLRPGTTAATAYSRGALFRLDEANLQAELIWQEQTETFTSYLGDADSLANGNVLLCAGGVIGPRAKARITEVTGSADSEPVWELTVDEYNLYRVTRLSGFSSVMPNEPKTTSRDGAANPVMQQMLARRSAGFR